MKRHHSLGVDWYPITIKKRGKLRTIGTTTKATSDYIVLLAQTHETISDVFNAVVFDREAKAVLQWYIDHGDGDKIARLYFR